MLKMVRNYLKRHVGLALRTRVTFTGTECEHGGRKDSAARSLVHLIEVDSAHF